MPRPFRTVLVVTLAVAVAGGALVGVQSVRGGEPASAADCAPGYTPVTKVLAEIRHELVAEGEGQALPGVEQQATSEAGRARAVAEREQALTHQAMREIPMLADVPRDEWASQCVRTERPESL